MHVFAIYPAFDPQLNEMAMVWQHLVQHAPELRCTVVCKTRDVLKGRDTDTLSESFSDGRLRVCRLQDWSAQAVLDVARSERPDLVFCATAGNLALARPLALWAEAPLALHTEYFSDDAAFVNRREYLGLNTLRPLVANRRRHRIRSETAHVFVSDPRDPITQEPDAAVSYLPWPHPAPAGTSTTTPPVAHDPDLVVNIGSLSGWKGAAVLQRHFTHVLNNLPSMKVKLVGPPIDKVGAACVMALQQVGGDRFEHVQSLPRAQALDLLGQALCAFVSGNRYSWGLIGDSWNSGTPVISQYLHYDLRAGYNALLAETPADLVAQLQRLRAEPALRAALIAHSRQTVAGHTIPVVADRLARQLRLLHRAAKAPVSVRPPV